MARKRSDVGSGQAARAVYIISVAAELAGVHPQTLRLYERRGLLRPKRTSGNTRRYSDRDIARLRLIQELTRQGVNLAGVKTILEMQAEIDELRARVRELEQQLHRARRAIPMGPGLGEAGILPLRSTLAFPWLEPRR